MKEDKMISETIALLRFPLTVFVVFIHYNVGVRGFSLHGVTYGLDAPDWFRWITAFFSDVLPRTAVPLFYIISGYLLFRGGKFDDGTYLRKLRSRVGTLLVPYLLWNVIAVLFMLSHRLPFLSSVFPSAHLMEVHLTPLRILHTFVDNYWNRGILVSPEWEGMVSAEPYPADGPLWYVRDLMLMLLLSPLIQWLIQRAGRRIVVALGALWCFRPVLFPMWDEGWGTMLLAAAFFFTWGSACGISGTGIVEGMRRWRAAVLLYPPVAIADALTKGWKWNACIHHAGIVLGVIAIVCVSSHLVASGRGRALSALAGGSFFVFALHTLVMDDLGKLLFTALHLSVTPFTLLLLYLAVPTLTILFSLATYIALRHLAPPLCHLLTGGR
ncbi:MAG: acyltransferase family protein [Bacteroidales bacterium]|nr:acyltransferase family protein [Bacteroidales bacterium]